MAYPPKNSIHVAPNETEQLSILALQLVQNEE